MNNYREYKRRGLSLMTPWVPGFDMFGVSISQSDLDAGSPKEGDMISKNLKDESDKWLVSKKYFEENLEEVVKGIKMDSTLGSKNGSFSFGDALKALKGGQKVGRSGWNGNGMYLYLVKGAIFPSLTEHAKNEFGEMTPYRSYFALKTAQNDIATWSPSGSDALSEDWCIVD